MASIGGFSGRTVFAAVAVAALALLPAQSAHASYFNYTFTGMTDGYFDGNYVGYTDFTLNVAEDTSALVDDGGGVYSYHNVNAALDTSDGDFTLTGLTLQVNGTAGSQSVGFLNSDGTDGLGLSMVTPVGYDLSSNLDVPVLWTNLTTADSGGVFLTSGGDTLEFSNVVNLGFTAVDPPAPAPEPSSLLLLASGLPGVALLRRRFLKA